MAHVGEHGNLKKAKSVFFREKNRTYTTVGMVPKSTSWSFESTERSWYPDTGAVGTDNFGYCTAIVILGTAVLIRILDCVHSCIG